MAKPRVPLNRMSNKALNRTLAHLIGQLAIEHGDHGILKIPMSRMKEHIKVGFEIDEDEDVLLVAVDMDGVKR